MDEKKVDEVDAATPPRQDENEESAAKADAATPPSQEKSEEPAAGTDAATQPRQEEEKKSADAASAIDWKTLYALLKADFENYKKRAARDREDVYRYAEADILKDILPSVDNLKLALDSAKDKEDPFVKGVQLVADTLHKALKEHGAEPFDSVGEKLDTEKMEAITMMPSPEVEEGKVVAEVKKGWTLKGKVLRAAQVVVSSGKPD